MSCVFKAGIALLLCGLLLCGCGRTETSELSLWVVTEESAPHGMNELTELMIGRFCSEHPGVTVRLDILPTEPLERELAVKRLRTQIMAGRGPDVFLLPSCNARRYSSRNWSTSAWYTLRYQVEPLLAVPEQSMRQGVFWDCSALFDHDDALNREGLQQTIMDAGVLDGARYLIPLRYDFPVLYVDTEAAAAMNIDLSALGDTITQQMAAVMAAKDPVLAAGMRPEFCLAAGGFFFLGSAVDYEKQTVLLERSQIAEFLRQFQALTAMTEGDPELYSYVSLIGYIYNGTGFSNYDPDVYIGFPRSIPLAVGTLSEAPMVAAISKVEEHEIAMVPLRGADGSLAADVTYYGAIGAGCQTPELAYDFLRLFLLDEQQWELSLPLQSGTRSTNANKEFHYHPIADGWPVRAKGAVEPLWDSIRPSLTDFNAGNGASKLRGLLGTQLGDEDIPLLDATIDRVSFGNSAELELGRILRSLNDSKTGAALAVDFDSLAEGIRDLLQYQLLEG